MSVVAIRWRGVAKGFVGVGGVGFVRGRGGVLGSERDDGGEVVVRERGT
jgi:hypothetical protein